MEKFLIPLRDYERIYKTIYSVLKSENANIVKSCLYFSIFGAFILQEHYKLNAQPVVGIAGYRIGGDEKNVLMFAEVVENQLACTENGFHCWVEVDGWLIDFMAPVFPQVMIADGRQNPCEVKMMQKKLDKMVESPDALELLGDFCMAPFPERMEEFLQNFYSKPANTDLVQISSNWYKRPPKKMLKRIPISDGKGNIKNVSLIGHSLTGVW